MCFAAARRLRPEKKGDCEVVMSDEAPGFQRNFAS